VHLQFTVSHAIQYLGDILPVHRLCIRGAADLVAIPTVNQDTADEAYEFEVSMSGYYSDPVEDKNNRKGMRSSMTHTNNQTCFAPTSKPLFKSILGSTRLRIGGTNPSHFFIEGEYTFAFAPTENGSCIELASISFNNTITQGQVANISPIAQVGDSTRRRNVQKKRGPSIIATPIANPPTTPQNKHSLQVVGSSVASSSKSTPYVGSSVQQTPATISTATDPAFDQQYQFGEYIDIDNVMPVTQETDFSSVLKKGKHAASRDDSEETVRRPKRQRKLTAKAAALHYVIDEAEEVGFDDLDPEVDDDNNE
jgi:hypothetical protein